MADAVLSPDGKFMWTGSEWIPAPPSIPQIAETNILQPPTHQTAPINTVNPIMETEFQKLDRFMSYSGDLYRIFHSTFKPYSRFFRNNLLFLIAINIFLIPAVYSEKITEDTFFLINTFPFVPIYFSFIWLPMGYFISRRKLKKMHGINSLKNNLNQTIHSYELVANMAYQNNDYKTIQRLNNYNVELQRSADFPIYG